MGALLGDEVVFGNPGDLAFKPRQQWHTFWNAGDAPVRLRYHARRIRADFAELVRLGGSTKLDPATLGALAARFGLEVDPKSIPLLVQRFDLKFPGRSGVDPECSLLNALGALRLRAPTIHARYGETSP